MYDCLRANKSLAWGIEGRVPFLDKEVYGCGHEN
jgi:hypothetical protein